MHPVARLWMSFWRVGGCLGEEGWRPSRGCWAGPQGPLHGSAEVPLLGVPTLFP